MDAAYIQKTMGAALADACAQVARVQPEDPVEWMASFLRHRAKLAEDEDVRKSQAEARARLLAVAATEEARLREMRAEEERLEAMRRPNEHQLECRAYLTAVDEREAALRTTHKDEGEYGVAALTAVSTDLSRLDLKTEVSNGGRAVAGTGLVTEEERKKKAENGNVWWLGERPMT